MNTATVATNPEDAAAAMSPALLRVPFTRAAFEHVEPAGLDITTPVLDATARQYQDDVVAYGHLRWLDLYVQATGGTDTGADAVAAPDSPWSVIQNVQVQDMNGRPIINLSGYELYLAHLLGGHAGFNNPASSPAYSAMTTAGNFAFALRLPIEISRRDALGAIPNQLANATYKVQVTVGTAANVFATAPSGVNPVVRVRAFLNAWSPVAGEARGALNETAPPDEGTTMFHSSRSVNIGTGLQQIELSRRGSLYKRIIAILRDSSGDRTEAGLPATLDLWYENSPIIESVPLALWRHSTYERHGLTLPSGVVEIGFDHELFGRAGGELRDLWLPVGSGSRVELRGSFNTGAAKVDIVTVDVQTASNVWD